jgi:uracil permease
MEKEKVIYDVNEKPTFIKAFLYGFQHLLACFGATVLVPLLVGIDPSRAVFTAGLGTIVYLFITKFKVPNFIGSSFAFISISTMAVSLGENYLCIGALAACLMFVITSLVIKKIGTDWIDKFLPPIVIGPVIMVIGLSLSRTAISMSGFIKGDFSLTSTILTIITLTLTISAMYSKKQIISSTSILIGLVGGYIITILLSYQFPSFQQYLTFKMPENLINYPTLLNPFAVELKTALIVAVSFMITSLATICEQVGHTMVTADIIEKDISKDPGLDKTIIGNGIATGIAGIFGSVSNVTYGESLGVLATTKVYSTSVFLIGAITAILLSLFAPFGEAVRSLPTPILGAVCILLYGIVAIAGIKQLIRNKVNFDEKRNLIIVSLMLVIGCGNAAIPVLFNNKTLELLGDISLSAVVGILLNIVLPKEKR